MILPPLVFPVRAYSSGALLPYPQTLDTSRNVSHSLNLQGQKSFVGLVVGPSLNKVSSWGRHFNIRLAFVRRLSAGKRGETRRKAVLRRLT